MKIGDRVKVKDQAQLATRWRGKEGAVFGIYGEKEPFFYDVPIEGFHLLFSGKELELVEEVS